MDEKLKQRLVGAAVLVSLAVIFVPMILDERDRDMGEPGSNLPPAPDFEVQDHIRPIELPPPLPEDEGPPEAAVTESGQAAGERPEPEPRPETGTTSTAEAPEPPANEARPETKPAASPPSPAAASQTGGTGTSTASAGEVTGWVVQVGSFGSERNARALAERLARAGFTAFVSRTEKNGRAFYRVRVGPVAEREAAEALKAKLDSHLGQKTLVLRAETGASR